MEPWYRLVTPRREVREGRSFNPDEFAIALEQVVAGSAPDTTTRSPSSFSHGPVSRALRDNSGLEFLVVSVHLLISRGVSSSFRGISRGPGRPGWLPTQVPHRSGLAHHAHPVPHLMNSRPARSVVGTWTWFRSRCTCQVSLQRLMRRHPLPL